MLHYDRRGLKSRRNHTELRISARFCGSKSALLEHSGKSHKRPSRLSHYISLLTAWPLNSPDVIWRSVTAILSRTLAVVQMTITARTAKKGGGRRWWQEMHPKRSHS